MALSTQSYKGARDFYPEDKRFQKYMFSTWSKVAEQYGYEAYDAPILEPTELFLAKGNQEIIDEQTYTFKDRGGRMITIRTEMTPTVSRLVAGKRQELAYPLRWYSIPNLWRYERPQKGRLREFWQLNVDIFGVDSIHAELEMLLLINDTFQAFGATQSMYAIKINHRGLINYLLTEHLKLDPKAQQKVAGLIDRMHKIDRSDLISKIDDLLSPEERESGVTEQLLEILDAKKLTDLPEAAGALPAVQELKLLMKQLLEAGIDNVSFDTTLMRGFEYYTGIVFEVFDTDPENSRSLLGGGRYDGLVGLFGVDPVPSVGFAWGDVTLSQFLHNHSLIPELKPETDLYIILLENALHAAQPIASELRNYGLNIALDYSGRKIGDQIRIAEKKNINHILIVGNQELESQHYTLKNLQSGIEGKYPLADVPEVIKKAA